MQDCPNTSIPYTPSTFQKKYVPVPCDFDLRYPDHRIEQIWKAFSTQIADKRKVQDAEETKTTGGSGKKRPVERSIVDAWVEVNTKFDLFPGYILNTSENKPDEGDKKQLKVDATLIAESDKEKIVPSAPNWALSRLPIEFKRGGREYDPFDDREGYNVEATAATRRHVRGQLMSYAGRVCSYQHRTKLFQLLINGDEFRMLRWDRGGVAFTSAVNYLESVTNMRLLLQLLYGFTMLDDCSQGVDHTAVPLSTESCGWRRMDVLGFPIPTDQAYKERWVPKGFKMPTGFAEPSADLSESPLFKAKHLHLDPTQTCDASKDHPQLCPDATPVWTYMRDLFRESLTGNYPRYQITVGDRKFLVAKPVFEANGMVGRGTRGYVALDWETQRFVFLKDAWRPFYDGVDKEGDVLDKLNKEGVLNVPTLITHGDVCERDGTEQETETSKYSPTYTAGTTQPPPPPKSKRKIAPLRASRPATNTGLGSQEPSADSKLPPLPASVPEIGNPPVSGPSSDKPEAGRGVKRSAKDAEAEHHPPGSGIRHMVHYRIIVAEVCLPCTAFPSSRIWAAVVLDCLRAHQAAYESCNIIHRDVSVGNILILPMLFRKDGSIVGIIWSGILTDWELAKDVRVACARQPERTGTWQFMSLRCLLHPTLPVTIPDELESFFHTLLYNAVRFLVHNYDSIKGLMQHYFDDTSVNAKSVPSAPLVKKTSMITGEIDYKGTILRFGPQEVHAMNDLVDKLLNLFRARYRVLRWEAGRQPAQPAKPTQEVDVLSSFSQPPVDARGSLQRARLRSLRPAREQSKPRPHNAVTTDPLRPTEEDQQLAESLKTHHAIVDIFEEFVGNDSLWTDNDTVNDRLHGYRQAPSVLASTAKPAKQAKTAPAGGPSARLAEAGRDVATGMVPMASAK
ncbi:hypothetical protein L227DRAFT_506295 [Lentinus tigrinus ALCF2SS1-6]|uniref:Fungal-type protein kinase domain-containing protein n=1 Tax=Lentinus tigrinus ALCF2SS1-6 TaxID=1328759 RepID=A0A5C2S483_9APHY|nr:hypothetical protein L227DRAFT_506295 [Lentinus tigrinus ALCF2SS1-6]